MHNKLTNLTIYYVFYFFLLSQLCSCLPASNSNLSSSDKVDSQKNEIALPQDQAQLAQLALTSSDWKLRERAVAQITNQEILAKVALNDSAWIVREAAMNSITDQKILARIATNTLDWKVREITFKNLQDQDLLVAIAQDVMGDPAVRSAAIDKIANANVVAQIGLSDPVPFVRTAAIWKITNQDTLTRIAQNDTNDIVRKEAIKALLTLEGVSTDKEAMQIKALLIDPSIYEHYGQMHLEYKIVEKIEDYQPDENRYSLAAKQKIEVRMEYKTVSILNKYKHVIYERIYKTPIGIASGKIDAEIYDSVLGRRYDSTIDMSEICYVLLKAFDNENLISLLNSRSDCLKTAASIRLGDN